MGGEGFEPSKDIASRFTVCPLWPLGYPPASSLENSGGQKPARRKKARAGDGNRTRNLLITNQLLYR